MADKKKLYDSPASKKARGEKPEPKKEAAAESKKESEPAEGEKSAEKPGDSRRAALEAIHARHRTERRDAHGGYRSELDKMASRHAKELDEAYVAGASTELAMTDGGVSKEVAAEPAEA